MKRSDNRRHVQKVHRFLRVATLLLWTRYAGGSIWSPLSTRRPRVLRIVAGLPWVAAGRAFID